MPSRTWWDGWPAASQPGDQPDSGRGHSLEELLDHRFADAELLRNALVHRSYTAEHPDEASNERLEFLGDSVLSLVVSDLLFSRYRHLVEGEMAKVRAATVNRDELAEVATRIGLGQYLLLGRGEDASGGREKGSILADTMEALLAALYLDGGIEPPNGSSWPSGPIVSPTGPRSQVGATTRPGSGGAGAGGRVRCT